MWYILPQIQGLGFSESARCYGIKDQKTQRILGLQAYGQ
ncbi:DUF1810 family protein [Pedobacter psychroterrae]|uniref:DUF1810 family protein n=1 Tax=Pedobacter psychroterrae TaxID=2530453 RepID=A0A4R0NXT2_9SPHI|nr:DUF1810 family protein [Pedobacter psychroterrae]